MSTFKSNKLKISLLITSLLSAFICIPFIHTTVNAEETITLKAEVGSSTSVLLSWNSSGTDSVYLIERSDNVDGPFSAIATLSDQEGFVSCYDTTAESGNTYYYRVAKIVDKTPVLYSNTVELAVTIAMPKNIASSISEESFVQLKWNKVKGAANYEIYRSTKKNKSFKKIGISKKNKYTDETVKPGTVYYYKLVTVKTTDPLVCSSKTAPFTVCIPPSAPYVSSIYKNKKLKLTWEKVKNATTYHIYKETEDGDFEKIGETDNLYFSDSNVKKGNSYNYMVTASYTKGEDVIEGTADVINLTASNSIDPKKKMVALTYDDGPGPYTSAIISCLKSNNAKATFFVLGSQVDSHKKQIKEANDIGCEIANHSYNHPRLTQLSKENLKKQIDDTDAKVKKITGKNTSLLRTPYGETNDFVKSNAGKPIILWSIDTLDWKTRNRDKTVDAVVNHVKDGDIVLMHDIHEPTKNASLIIIPRLKKMGYQLVTVSELAQYRGYKLANGGVYHRLSKKK